MKNKKRILVVDDEQGIRELFSIFLQSYGYEVETVSNGEEGLEKYTHASFDLVCTDIHMPKKNGVELAEEIKRLNPNQLIILFTGHADKDHEYIIRANKIGVFDCIFKPFDLDKCLFTVQMALSTMNGVSDDSNIEKELENKEIMGEGVNFSENTHPQKEEDMPLFKKILVIDDEEGILQLLESYFSSLSCSVTTINESKSVMELFNNNSYDCILCDINMPGLSGMDIYDFLRQNHNGLEKKIIFLTGDAFSEKTESFLERTGNRFLQKPFNFSELRLIIKSLQ